MISAIICILQTGLPQAKLGPEAEFYLEAAWPKPKGKHFLLWDNNCMIIYNIYL